MTNTELIQAIKAEIERHLNSATEHQNANPDMPKYRWYLYEGEKELCTDLLGYIDDSLESEKPIEELEEEIREYMSNEDNNPFDWDWRDKRDCARHFAKWGAEHAKIESENPVPTDLEEAAEEYSKKVSDGHNYRDLRVGFIAGYKYHADHTPLPEDTVLFNKGVEEGKRLMMEEAAMAEMYDNKMGE